MVNNIRRKRIRIEESIRKLSNQLDELRDECPHSEVLKTHKSDTGNYDPRDNRYWTEFYCPDCTKRWHVEGSV